MLAECASTDGHHHSKKRPIKLQSQTSTGRGASKMGNSSEKTKPAKKKGFNKTEDISTLGQHCQWGETTITCNQYIVYGPWGLTGHRKKRGFFKKAATETWVQKR